jgi:hypothetical protein
MLRTELENEAEAGEGGRRESVEERHGRESGRQGLVLITTRLQPLRNNLSSCTGFK